MRQAEFAVEAKRRIAIRLVSTGRWRAHDWPALSAVVRSSLLGLDEEGCVVESPDARRARLGRHRGATE